MATTPTTIPHSRPGKPIGSKKLRTSTLIAAVIGLLVAAAYLVSTLTAAVDEPAVEIVSEEDTLRDLVNRGLIPAQTLEPAPRSEEEILRDLVNRGLIPRQALDE